ncbi:hypothetical protein Poly30_55590 [Planctomycetes bacterium Poly30]|uniref:Uncharacterized protein n=1 Tax=Saltatorellus ferox TaxID=2528018 RepID=A0A518F0Y1_9BACT|nr:hypothetical protein Poly30_55590 [Planctomycetes bacterium Poly30]
MTHACMILFIMGVLGATDIVVFHVAAHDLRNRPESRAELVTHFLRGPTYAALFFVLPNFTLNGGWFVALLALLVVDALISVVDFWLEPESRRTAGGLPRGEYLLHVILAGLFGALVAVIVLERGGHLDAPTAIHWMPRGTGVPDLLRLALTAMAPIVLFTGLLDLRAVLRLGSRRT